MLVDDGVVYILCLDGGYSGIVAMVIGTIIIFHILFPFHMVVVLGCYPVNILCSKFRVWPRYEWRESRRFFAPTNAIRGLSWICQQHIISVELQ